jgi:GNAT superfamily N-acetyltransferase
MLSLRTADLTTDAPAMARLLSLTMPEAVTADQVAEWWRPRENEIRSTTVALNSAGQVIGLADVESLTWKRAGLFRMRVIVATEWRKQGIGKQLYGEALRFACTHKASALQSSVKDTDAAALRFAEQRGFAIDRHTFESVLDLSRFDESAFAGGVEQLQAAGFRFLSLAAAEMDVEQAQRKLYALNRETGLDNPGNDGTFPSYDAFRQNVFEASWFRPDGQILAADGERWVALAAIALSPQHNSAYNAFTGVDREYRGRGLAYAVKLLAIRWAKQSGALLMRTDNDSQNGPMLAVNRKLGYQPEPGTYQMVCRLPDR